jgi:energy-coupling factor transport system substrate-specific component
MINSQEQKNVSNQEKLALIPLGIALNLIIGTIAHTLKTPIYLDAIGTILITIVLGCRAGMITGVCSFLIGGILVNPFLPYFCGTQVAIAVYVYVIGRFGGLKGLVRPIFSGIGLGIVAALVSAPVIAFLFGGITGSGRSLITAFLMKTGENVLNSVIYSGIAAEPIDKTIQIFIAIWLIKSLPKSLLTRYQNTILFRNKFLPKNVIQSECNDKSKQS